MDIIGVKESPNVYQSIQKGQADPAISKKLRSSTGKLGVAAGTVGGVSTTFRRIVQTLAEKKRLDFRGHTVETAEDLGKILKGKSANPLLTIS